MFPFFFHLVFIVVIISIKDHDGDGLTQFNDRTWKVLQHGRSQQRSPRTCMRTIKYCWSLQPVGLYVDSLMITIFLLTQCSCKILFVTWELYYCWCLFMHKQYTCTCILSRFWGFLFYMYCTCIVAFVISIFLLSLPQSEPVWAWLQTLG